MIQRMAEQIRKAYPADAEIVCVGVLKGAWIFHADLVRALERDVLIDFMRATSYGSGTQTSGVVRILKDIEVDIRGKHVLLIEEIVDSGRTLSFIQQRLASGNAASVKIAALLDKKARREVPCEADFVGAVVDNYFLVGYGLDWAEKYRNLPGVYKVHGEKLT
ncbi:MAG: hypoxanthine phosphoribosyltransferase [Bdellovibrionales bacterium]|nr:hypoxanthine phosphoribosyltransferase [Bdellovibrionales bacterium]